MSALVDIVDVSLDRVSRAESTAIVMWKVHLWRLPASMNIMRGYAI